MAEPVERTGARTPVRTVTENMNVDLQSVSAPPAPVAHVLRSGVASTMKKDLPGRIVRVEGDYWRIRLDRGESSKAEEPKSIAR
jgi:hypothetical protein